MFFQKAKAQSEKDTIVYFMENSGRVAASKDSADYIMLNMPADSSSGVKLYPVVEYYRNGKRRLIAASKNRSSYTVFEGTSIMYYPNGKRERMAVNKDGRPLALTAYYPNGQLYSSMKLEGADLKYEDCRDSTGKILAENGEGKWIDFDGNYKTIISEGPIHNGKAEGEWNGIKADSIKYTYVFAGGKIISGVSYDKTGAAYPFTKPEVEPQYKEKGGVGAFADFVGRMIHSNELSKMRKATGILGYPDIKIYISFIVEKDGTLSNIDMTGSSIQGLRDEVIRVVKLSHTWIPATQFGIPVRTRFTVPITFNSN